MDQDEEEDDDDDEDEGGGPSEPSESTSGVKIKREEDSSNDASEHGDSFVPVKKIKKNPDVDTSFLPGNSIFSPSLPLTLSPPPSKMSSHL